MANNKGVCCVNLPEDLALALRTRAEAEGNSVSEVLRSLIHQWVYDERPSVDDGYRAGRSVGMKVAHMAVSQVVGAMPETYDQAIAMIRAVQG